MRQPAEPPAKYDKTMLAEWSIECSAEAPVLVVPWPADASDQDPPGSASPFVDLRQHPDAGDQIPEAEAYPPLMQALHALNAAHSPVFTAKCDAWPLADEELDHLQLQLDLTADEAPAGFASYIDLLWQDRGIFASMHRQQQLQQRIVRYAAALQQPMALLELVLRPALVDLNGPQEGFATTLYIKALGDDEREAWQNWAAALKAVVTLLRGKEIASAV